MGDLVAIAKLIKPRGLRGEMAAEVLTDFPERFEGLKDVTVVLDGDHEPQNLTVENSWFQNDRVILKFAGIDSIEAVDGLRGAEICIDESDAVELEDGEFFDWELDGCEVVTTAGDVIGTVREVMRTGGTEILVIVDDGKIEKLVPFAESICLEVDIKGKRIVIDPPEGLLEF